MEDLLRLSPWSGGKFFGSFCSPLCILCVGCRKHSLIIRVLMLSVFQRESEKHCSRNLSFSLIIVKSLQLHGRRQIAEPHKYCLVHVIVFFGVCFLYFLFLTGWEFELIPYKDKIWYRHI